jgi:UDP-N-acetylglucosamine 2-epimerase
LREKYESIKKRFTPNPFGDGQAARRIVKAIESFTHLSP